MECVYINKLCLLRANVNLIENIPDSDVFRIPISYIRSKSIFV